MKPHLFCGSGRGLVRGVAAVRVHFALFASGPGPRPVFSCRQGVRSLVGVGRGML
jgi:hypothetical protein